MGRLRTQDDREEREHKAEQQAVVHVEHNSRQESEHPNQLYVNHEKLKWNDFSIVWLDQHQLYQVDKQ